MILSEEEMDERQAPMPVWMCGNCERVYVDKIKCKCLQSIRKMSKRGVPVLKVLQAMSASEPRSAFDIADKAGLPRRSIKTFLAKSAVRPWVPWRGEDIAIFSTDNGEYYLGRELSEYEKNA